MTIPHRYKADRARHHFSQRRQIALWQEITQTYAEEAMRDAVFLDDVPSLYKPSTIDELAVATREQDTGHDVVAFLSLFLEQIPYTLHPFVHQGLTSSDLVENATHLSMQFFANDMVAPITALTNTLGRFQMQETPRSGRTHGQRADVTSLNWQWGTFRDSLRNIRTELINIASSPVWKSPGPTGHSPFPQVQARGPRVAERFGAVVVPSTQIIPRDYMLAWASALLRLSAVLENLALHVRLGSRSEVGEFTEGAAASRVGSSAMPHKKNPIASEKVSGLARVARGFYLMIAENCALWEDRDLSNSSAERVALSGLAETVEHMTMTMYEVINNLDVDFAVTDYNIRQVTNGTNIAQVAVQRHLRVSFLVAADLVREYKLTQPSLAHWRDLTEHYPTEAVNAARAEFDTTWARVTYKEYTDGEA